VNLSISKTWTSTTGLETWNSSVTDAQKHITAKTVTAKVNSALRRCVNVCDMIRDAPSGRAGVWGGLTRRGCGFGLMQHKT